MIDQGELDENGGVNRSTPLSTSLHTSPPRYHLITVPSPLIVNMAYPYAWRLKGQCHLTAWRI